MNREPVELKVGGQRYRVVASTDEAELQRLASLVDGRLREIAGPNRAIAPQTLLLAALALAHDLEQERARSQALEERSKTVVRSILSRIDAALAEGDPDPDPVDDEAEATPAP